MMSSRTGVLSLSTMKPDFSQWPGRYPSNTNRQSDTSHVKVRGPFQVRSEENPAPTVTLILIAIFPPPSYLSPSLLLPCLFCTIYNPVHIPASSQANRSPTSPSPPERLHFFRIPTNPSITSLSLVVLISGSKTSPA